MESKYSKETKKILDDLNIIVDGHFVFNSGLHSGKYVNKDALYPYASRTRKICRYMAQTLSDHYSKLNIRVIVSPEKGGVPLSQYIADELTNVLGHEVLAFYLEKGPNKTFNFTRRYDKLLLDYLRSDESGENPVIFVAEDTFTSGDSVKRVIEKVLSLGEEIKIGGVIGIVNRGGVDAKKLEVDNFSWLLSLDLPSYKPEECPLCKSNMGIDTTLGHGNK